MSVTPFNENHKEVFYSNRPWPAIANHIRSKYNVIGEIDLIDILHPVEILNKLKLVYKDRYEPNDRILIYHYDTDFYYTNNSPGFTIYNLISCLRALDISSCFCLMLTNHYGIHKELDTLITDEIKMHVFENSYQLMQSTPTPKVFDININKIKKSYINLNGSKRSHRVLFLSYLREYKLLDSGILSWHFNSPINKEEQKNPNKINTFVDENTLSTTLITTVPHTRINDKFYHDSYSKEIFNAHQHYFLSNWKDPSISGGANKNRWDIPAIQEAFLYVSVETTFEYPYPYLTEKTFRAILHKRPFVIVGATGSLDQIKKLGFKTFNNLWSEDYDSIADPNKRMRAVLNIIKHISSLSVDQLQELMYNIQDIIEFNYNFYVNNFSNKILQDRLESL